MMLATHCVLGMFMAMYFLFLVNVNIDLGVLIFAFVGSLIPDIDTPNSMFGQVLYPISSTVNRWFGHRTFTHSALFILVACALFYPLTYYFSLRYYAALIIGLFSHTFADMFTKEGVQFWWPAKIACVSWYDSRYRLRVGSHHELVTAVIFWSLFLVVLPVAMWGMRTSLYYTSHSVGNSIEYAKSKFLDYRLLGKVDGMWNMRQKAVGEDEQFEVVKVNVMDLIVRLNSDKRYLYLLAEGSPFTAAICEKLYLEIGEPIQRKDYGRTYANETLDLEFMRAMNRDDVLITGTLNFKPDAEILAALNTPPPTPEALNPFICKVNRVGEEQVAALIIDKAVGSLFYDIFNGRNAYVMSGQLNLVVTTPAQAKKITELLSIKFYQ